VLCFILRLIYEKTLNGQTWGMENGEVKVVLAWGLGSADKQGQALPLCREYCRSERSFSSSAERSFE